MSDNDDDGYIKIVEDTIGPPDDWEDKRGKYANVSDIDLEDLPPEIEHYLTHYVKTHKEKRTFLNRNTVSKHWTVFCVARAESDFESDVDFVNPDPVDVEDFVTDQLAAGYMQSSIENSVYALSAMFNYFVKHGTIEENPIRDDSFEMDLKTNSTFQDIRYIKKEDFEKLFAETSKLRDQLLLRLLWDTGVRAEELVSIYESDLKREEQKIELKTAKQEGGREKKRTVFYSRKCETLLRKWLDKGGRKQYLSHDESPYLLIGKGTGKLDSRRPTEIIRECAEAAGVQSKSPTPTASGEQRRKVTAHCFRHSFAVLRVKQGMPIVYLSDLLGHSDIQQTRIYLNFRDDDLKEAYDKYRP